MTTKKLVFDTLQYAKMLSDGGVENSDVHASTLADVLVYNIYTKNEVDMSIENALRKSDEKWHESIKMYNKSTLESEKKWHESEKRFNQTVADLRKFMHEMEMRHKIEMRELESRIDRRFDLVDKRFQEIENRFEKTMNRYLYKTITILGSLITIMGALVTFAQHFFR